MLSSHDIKRKIKSIGNTKQLTKAMEMVAAAKMRKSQQLALQSRPYCENALELLGNLSYRVDYKLHPLLSKREIKKIALLVVTDNKGLCGGFNSNVLKLAQKFLGDNKKETDIIAVGKKGRDYFAWRKYNIAAEFTEINDDLKLEEIFNIADYLIDSYKSGKYDLIMAVYTNFHSTLKQEDVIRQVMPINIESIREAVNSIVPEKGRYADLKNAEPREDKKESYFWRYEYKFEPSTKKVLNELLPNLLRIQVYHMILESNASKHSARMIAMKNASENADELIQELNLTYNKLRQSVITKEISEITAGSEALSQ